ncbi:MAG: DUF503 domain-containing protein [Proteobacteria bacterium]|nr:DUF503 domain-containing protein [Pseudomonadota bacterium]
MSTFVGVKRISFMMPENGSLGDKRQILRKLRDTLTSKFNISFSDIDTDDKWQKSIIAVSMVANDEQIIRTTFQQISNLIETIVEVRIFNDVNDVFRYEDEAKHAWMS